jgi:hypothetical protein
MSINLQNSFKNINFNVLILFVVLQQQKHYAICCFEIESLTKKKYLFILKRYLLNSLKNITEI